jgi:hypothetical protein
MQDLSINVPFNGDFSKAVDAAAGTLMSHGFRIARRTESEIDFEGPEYPYQRRSLYWGARTCRLNAAGGQLHLAANMDIMRRSNQLGLKLSAVAVGLLAVLVAVSAVLSPQTILLSLLVSIGLPSFVALLMMWVTPYFNRQTTSAYETLLKNAAMMAAPKGSFRSRGS